MNKLYLTLGATMVACLILIYSCNDRKTPADQEISRMWEITDMAGRKVVIPKKPEKVFCADMTVTMLLYSLSPELLIGTNNKLTPESKPFVTESFFNLPALGRIFLGKSSINEEELIKLHPDILICPLFSFTGKAIIEDFERTAQRLGIPAILVDMEINKLADTYAFLGKIFNNTEKALILSEYCQRTLNLAAKAKKQINGSVSFYVAEGVGGLNTIPAGSTHSAIFELVGLKNCANVDEKFGYTDMQINTEQLIEWDPYLIFLSSREHEVEKDVVLNNKAWGALSAVKNRHVITIPDKPFNFIGRPPGINRLIGVYWLVQQVLPGLLEQNMASEAADFYTRFYHIRPTQSQMDSILSQGTN